MDLISVSILDCGDLKVSINNFIPGTNYADLLESMPHAFQKIANKISFIHVTAGKYHPFIARPGCPCIIEILDTDNSDSDSSVGRIWHHYNFQFSNSFDILCQTGEVAYARLQ